MTQLQQILDNLPPDITTAVVPVNEVRAILAQNELLRGEQHYFNIQFAFEPNAESQARLHQLIIDGYQLIRKGELISNNVFEFLEAHDIKAKFETQTVEGQKLWTTRN